MHEGFGYVELNEECGMTLVFVTSYDFRIINAHFKKRDEHLITKVTTIVRFFFLTRALDRVICKSCIVILGDSLRNQHRWMIYDICCRNGRRKI